MKSYSLQVVSIAIFLGVGTVSPGSGSVEGAPPEQNEQDVQSDKAVDLEAGFNGRITAMLLVPNGSGDTYVAGEFASYRGRPVGPLVRVRPDGSLDPSFRLARAIASRVSAIAPANDGSGDLYVADYAMEPAPPAAWRFQSTVRRIHADGTIDKRFAPAAFAHEDTYVPDARFVPVVTSVASVDDGSGRVYAAGRFGVARLNRDGSRDAGFRYGVSAFHVVPAKDGSGDVFVTSNERIAVSGRHASQRIVRVKPDGTRDPKFDAGSGVAPHWNIFTVVPVEDGTGDLFVGGNFAGFANPNPYAPNAVRLLARVNPNGSLDRTSPRPRIDERRGPVIALARTDDGSGDWLVTQGQEILRYSADGATSPGVAKGSEGDRPVASASAVPSTTQGR